MTAGFDGRLSSDGRPRAQTRFEPANRIQLPRADQSPYNDKCMTSDTKRCQATPSWTISVPSDFTAIDNGDSWQAHADTRVLYVSSMKVQNGGAPIPATVLRATLARSLEPAAADERHQLEESGVVGDAQIIRTPQGFELKGFACTDGDLATCVISFEQDEHRDWAVSTWRSLRPASSP